MKSRFHIMLPLSIFAALLLAAVPLAGGCKEEKKEYPWFLLATGTGTGPGTGGPVTITHVASYPIPAAEAKRVFVQNDIAYVACSNGLRIVDVSDPAYPAGLSVYAPGGSMHDVYVVDNYAYLSGGGFGFHVIDISDPVSPSFIVDGANMGTDGMHVVGDIVYLTGGFGFIVGDISNPSDPFPLWCSGQLGDVDVYYSNGFAYLAATAFGEFIIYNVQIPASPTMANYFYLDYDAYGVWVKDDFAYLATHEQENTGGLFIVNVANPYAPVIASVYDQMQYANSVEVVGNYAYVSDGAGLKVLDVTDPYNPVLAGSWNSPGIASGLYVHGAYVYLTDYTEGLQIVRVDPQ